MTTSDDAGHRGVSLSERLVLLALCLGPLDHRLVDLHAQLCLGVLA